jgi:hypothetical protein
MWPTTASTTKRSTGEGSCPFTALYWIFLERNEAVLANNFRLQMPYRTLHKNPPRIRPALRPCEYAIDHMQSFCSTKVLTRSTNLGALRLDSETWVEPAPNYRF